MQRSEPLWGAVKEQSRASITGRFWRCETRLAIKRSTWMVSSYAMDFRFNNMTSKKMNKRKPILSDDQLSALEEHLAGTLKPVTPPMEVVQRLRERIRFPQPEQIVSRLRDWERMFFVFGGVMSGMLVLITLARAFYYL